jgi:hypothetical protein
MVDQAGVVGGHRCGLAGMVGKANRNTLPGLANERVEVATAIQDAADHDCSLVHAEDDGRPTLEADRAQPQPQIVSTRASLGKICELETGCFDTVDVCADPGMARLRGNVTIETEEIRLRSLAKNDFSCHVPQPPCPSAFMRSA